MFLLFLEDQSYDTLQVLGPIGLVAKLRLRIYLGNDWTIALDILLHKQIINEQLIGDRHHVPFP